MCNKIVVAESEEAVGQYKKGNEPESMEFPIIVAPCECGRSWWAKVAGGKMWVEAKP